MLLIEQYDKILNQSLTIDKELFYKNYPKFYYDIAKKNFSRFWYDLDKKLRLKWLELASLECELYHEFNKLIRYVYDVSAIEFDKLFYNSFYTKSNHEPIIDEFPNKLYWFKYDIVKFWNSLDLEEKNKFISLIIAHKFEIAEIYPTYYNYKPFETIKFYNQTYTQEQIDNLPNGLLELGCSGCKIKSLNNLPPSIVHLDCGNNYLESLDNLPENLVILICPSNNIRHLNNLPNKLEYLDIRDNWIKELKNLPHTLKILNAENNYLTEITGLPENLEKLDISYNNILSLEGLPINLKVLRFEHCSINSISNLPENLECLILEKSNDVVTIENLPNSLKYLDISETYVSELNILPVNLEYLDISRTEIINLSVLPSTLKILNVYDTEIEDIENLPDGLVELTLSSKVKNTKLPKTLIKITMRENNNFIELPDSIKYLDCTNSVIKNIKYLPNNIKNVYCHDTLKIPLILPYPMNSHLPNNKFISSSVL